MVLDRLPRLPTWILIAIVVLVPLYELADSGEHWPNDGTVVLTLLAILLPFLLCTICRCLLLRLTARRLLFSLLPISFSPHSLHEATFPSDFHSCFGFCLLRI
jgi:hypothetical protein